ncbi:MAG: peptidoglycan-binding protein, partial [Acutalibacteraceae bacterium]|nr:peptidoglycan-binding protein [Acutalibacteraceae bacterium]
MPTTPFIPETITVHLGPPDSPAQNVMVNFVDYLKSVAASEIYPTWPENAIRANIYAQISFALNRVYTEWYRSRGYDFDITNTTAFDQAYTYGRDTFQTTDRIVEEIFNDYIVRQGFIEPLLAQFCNGTTSTCAGLSQWGTVDLANQGYTPYQILTNYYGDNINIVNDAPVMEAVASYPGTPLRRGSAGNDVRILQVRLNRISNNYPAIPKIENVNGVYGADTEEAVRKFQEIFNLTADGVTGKSTWYKVNSIFNGVKKLAELDSEGLRLQDISKLYSETLQLGSRGMPVEIIQYYLATLALVNPQIQTTEINGN